MNIVNGSVSHRETGAALAEVQVVIYSVLPETALSAVLPQIMDGQTFDRDLYRLGSTQTDDDGRFEVRYDAERRERGIHLILALFAPESAGDRIVMHVSPEIRWNAGQTESYAIRLTSTQLKDANLPIPLTLGTSRDEYVATLRRSETDRTVLAVGARILTSERLARKRKVRQKFESEVRPALVRGLLHTTAKELGSGLFVAPEEPAKAVTDRVAKAVRTRLTNVVNRPAGRDTRAPVIGRARLTEAQQKRLTEAGTRDETGTIAGVPQNVVDELFGSGATPSEQRTYHLDLDAIKQLCRTKTVGEQCLDSEATRTDATDDEATGVPRVRDSGSIAGPGIDISSEVSIKQYVASLVDQTHLTDVPVAFNSQQRAKQGDIQGVIDMFAINAGPADVPAFYDFHNLQIAFEHVWEEALDKNVLKNAAALYEAIVELGGDPPSGASANDLCEAAEETMRSSMIDPPPMVLRAFDITFEEWNVLDRTLQDELTKLAVSCYAKRVVAKLNFGFGRRDNQPAECKAGNRIIKYARERLRSGYQYVVPKFTEFHGILKSLCEQLASDYSFKYFAARDGECSVNFGILLTYRQFWDPQTYQVGELIDTVPLAPKQTRTIKKRTTHNTKRAEKEVTDNLMRSKTDVKVTVRVEEAIISKARAKTNFSLAAQGGYQAKVWNASAKSAFSTEASKESNDTKKDFREAVVNATQEFKTEHKTEISTDAALGDEFTEEGELVNPNEELPVTFLFYELQRRYKVKERLHRALPVVLVAQELPNPADIDEDWLITYDWILRRVILDTTFIPALNYVSTKIVGDEIALNELKKHVDAQATIMQELKEEVVAYRELVGVRYDALLKAIDVRASEVADDDHESFFTSVKEFFSGDDTSPEAARIREQAARDAYEKAKEDERELMGRLNRVIATHNAAMEAYTKALQEHLNRVTQVSRLKVHIKQNILYYMQAIWLHEPPDQRFLRLHQVPVPVFTGTTSYKFKPSNAPFAPVLFELENPATHFAGTNWDYEVDVDVDPNFATKPLVEVADIDDLLGFKGNYMIFRLKQSNVLTDFMLTPYINQEWNTVYDPDVEGTMTLDEFSQYVCCLKEHLKSTPEIFNRLKPELRLLLEKLLTSPLRDNEEIVVPTDSLYIEALPGAHPLLEDFKLMHRAIDVNRADADQKARMLENIRLAARLLDSQLDDPEVEAKYLFSGDASAAVVQPTPPDDE